MHELALSHSILDIVVQRAAEAGLKKVTEIVLEVGEAAGVEAEALRFCFEAVTRDTMAHGAALRIERVPLRGLCPKCRHAFPLPSGFGPCPRCRSHGAALISGRELRVREFEGV
jgi:hydrogenase nickel incorporation protein HypA/HybF